MEQILFKKLKISQRKLQHFFVDGNKCLLSVLNKTLKVMPENLLTGSISRYVKESEKVTFADFIKDNLRTVSLICLGAITIVLVMILGLLRESRRAEIL